MSDYSNLIRSLILVESGGNPNIISPDGAVGLMQILPSTARDPGNFMPNIFEIAKMYGRDIGQGSEEDVIRLLKDPELNIEFGTMYLNGMIQKYGNLGDGLQAYNAGPGNMDNFIAKDRSYDALDEEAHAYKNKVSAVMQGQRLDSLNKEQWAQPTPAYDNYLNQTNLEISEDARPAYENYLNYVQDSQVPLDSYAVPNKFEQTQAPGTNFLDLLNDPTNRSTVFSSIIPPSAPQEIRPVEPMPQQGALDSAVPPLDRPASMQGIMPPMKRPTGLSAMLNKQLGDKQLEEIIKQKGGTRSDISDFKIGRRDVNELLGGNVYARTGRTGVNFPDLTNPRIRSLYPDSAGYDLNYSESINPIKNREMLDTSPIPKESTDPSGLSLYSTVPKPQGFPYMNTSNMHYVNLSEPEEVKPNPNVQSVRLQRPFPQQYINDGSNYNPNIQVVPLTAPENPERPAPNVYRPKLQEPSPVQGPKVTSLVPGDPRAEGIDTIPAMLTEGEAVIPTEAAQIARNRAEIERMVKEGREIQRRKDELNIPPADNSKDEAIADEILGSDEMPNVFTPGGREKYMSALNAKINPQQYINDGSDFNKDIFPSSKTKKSTIKRDFKPLEIFKNLLPEEPLPTFRGKSKRNLPPPMQGPEVPPPIQGPATLSPMQGPEVTSLIPEDPRLSDIDSDINIAKAKEAINNINVEKEGEILNDDNIVKESQNVIVSPDGGTVTDTTTNQKIDTKGLAGWIEQNLGFTKQDLLRTLIYYIGGRLAGGSHGGSLRWAGSRVLKEIDARRAEKLARDKEDRAYKRAIDVARIQSGGSSLGRIIKRKMDRVEGLLKQGVLTPKGQAYANNILSSTASDAELSPIINDFLNDTNSKDSEYIQQELRGYDFSKKPTEFVVKEGYAERPISGYKSIDGKTYLFEENGNWVTIPISVTQTYSKEAPANMEKSLKRSWESYDSSELNDKNNKTDANIMHYKYGITTYQDYQNTIRTFAEKFNLPFNDVRTLTTDLIKLTKSSLKDNISRAELESEKIPLTTALNMLMVNKEQMPDFTKLKDFNNIAMENALNAAGGSINFSNAMKQADIIIDKNKDMNIDDNVNAYLAQLVDNNKVGQPVQGKGNLANSRYISEEEAAIIKSQPNDYMRFVMLIHFANLKKR